MEYETVQDHFRRYFVAPDYDGSYGTPISSVMRHDFGRLTDGHIIWAQVHGDFKNVAKRALFKPYPHWRELYQLQGRAGATLRPRHAVPWSRNKRQDYARCNDGATCAA